MLKYPRQYTNKKVYCYDVIIKINGEPEVLDVIILARSQEQADLKINWIFSRASRFIEAICTNIEN